MIAESCSISNRCGLISRICSSVNKGLPKSNDFKSQIGSDAIDDSLSTTNGYAAASSKNTTAADSGSQTRRNPSASVLKWRIAMPMVKSRKSTTVPDGTFFHFKVLFPSLKGTQGAVESAVLASSGVKLCRIRGQPVSLTQTCTLAKTPGKITSLRQQARCPYLELRVKPYDSRAPRTCGLNLL